MNIVIRADASLQIGSGHVMRGLTLAEALRDRGATVHFICRDLPGHLGGVLADQGYPVHWLPAPAAEEVAIPAHTVHSAWLGVLWAVDADQTRERLAGWPEIDWLIVDHYALDRAWESRMRPLVKRIMAIDDLADRPHDCDLLLDQNLVADLAQRYDGKLPAHCGRMLGPEYALLQPQYAACIRAHPHERGRFGACSSISAGPTPRTSDSRLRGRGLGVPLLRTALEAARRARCRGCSVASSRRTMRHERCSSPWASMKRSLRASGSTATRTDNE